MSVSDKPLVLVDGSSYLFRAYFAMPPLTNAQGEPTGAIYGVLNMIRKLIKDYDPEHLAIIFDPKGKTFRNELYSEYKANRAEMPDELRVQIAPLHEAIRALGLPLIIVDGVEADDVIGTLAVQAQKEGLNTLISTGDKDMAQLVNDHVTLVNTMNDKMLDHDGVQEKFGVTPEQIIDYLALMGDTSDNIPGVPKVGPKTAAKWIAQYGSLDEIVAHADEIKGKVGENLRASLDQLSLSRELVTIKCDVDLSVAPQELTPQAPDKTKLHELYQHFEFKRWLQELQQQDDEDEACESIEPAATEYAAILDEKTFDAWIDRLQRAKQFAFDTETTSLNAMEAELVGVSFSDTMGQAAYVPLAHDYMGAPKQLSRDAVVEKLKSLLNDSSNTIIGQNLKYDLKVLRHYGITVDTQFQDTMLQSYVLNSTGSRHDMDTLAMQYLNHTTIKFEDVAGKGAKQIPFNQVALEEATPYAAEDADITLQLDKQLRAEVESEPNTKKVYYDIELPLMPILMDMEYRGVLIDVAMLQQQSEEIAKRLTELQKDTFDIAGEEFNLDSPKQLQAILYEKLKLPVLKKTPKGAPSTAENVLQDLALDYPLPKLILEYRSLSKLKSTYTDKLPQQVNSKSGRVHTHYKQTVTSTGRLSSKEPNLQNIPVRTERGRKIRQAFIAPKNYKIVAADYSQIELRIMAHLSKDPGLLKAFEHGLDVHRATASEVFGVKHDEVTPDQRRSAKAINFGLMYGMSAFGLAQQLGIERNAAQEYIDVYFHRYPKVHEYMEQARKTAAKQGYVETLFGRRLYIAEIKSSNAQRRMAAERAAINAPLQGSAADIIKYAMIAVTQWLRDTKADVHMIMQVHDELVFEVAESQLESAIKEIHRCMESAADLAVPLIVDVGVGDNWDEAH